MLLELGLRNFKAFGDKEQKAPLSKITLIYGPNSGGKSSIIQALLLIKQSLVGEWSRDSGRRELIYKGEYVDLGSFAFLLHKHDIERELKIGVTFNDSYSTKSSVDLTLIAMEKSSFLSEIGYQILEGNEVLLDAKLDYEHDTNTWDTSQLSIAGVNGSREIFPRKLSSLDKKFLPVMEIQGLKRTQRILQRQGTELAQELETAQKVEISLKDLERKWGEVQKIIQQTEPIEKIKRMEIERLVAESKELAEKAIQEEQKQELLARKQVKTLTSKVKPEQIEKLNLVDIPSSYENLLRSITYMGPLRNYPERFYPVSDRGRNSAGIRGEFIPHILYHNANIRQEVNRWFELFGIPYRLDIDEFGEEQRTGKYFSITLEDNRTKTLVTLADVGFGINQLLPIVIEGIVSEKNAIICVEQPEIHLHPRLQANIADLMIETSTGKDGKQWIVETHSELLIRRIQRHIREETLNPNDVSVIYVNPGDEGSKIEVLELDEDGDFTDEWPHGFFDEGFNELMGE
ncbi:MAG: DUF3696 domain-containing protein [Gemmatimonadota bacterium]|nr:DUF3696 domain-containing protein [Gemmatimonadota bacterium]MDE2954113.1 DUF3696 domain-containing protein [Gemmatimonadota bacterium]